MRTSAQVLPSYDDYCDQDKWDITKTEGYRMAMDDVANGRVTPYDTVDDFFAEMKAEVAAEAKAK